MRYLSASIFIIFLSLTLFPLTLAGDVYMWTDEEGVVHITDNPRSLPPGDDVERIRYRSRDDANRQPVSDKKRDIKPARKGIEEEEAVSDRDKGLPEGPHRGELERKIERASEEYDRARELVEKQRRHYSRKNTRPNWDRYKRALDELAEKREKLRELRRQN